MKVKAAVKEIAPCEKLISVSVAGEMIREEYETVYREISRVARVPGFRPGKAPREIVSVHYKEEAREEVLKKLLSKSLRSVMDEHRITPLSRPEIRKVDFTEQSLTFDAYVETRPEFTLPEYHGVRVNKNTPAVKPEEIDQAIEELRHGYAKFVPIEDRGLAFGDFITADLQVLSEGKLIEKREDDWIEFSEKAFMPEFSQALLGARPGDAREIEVNFPKDEPRPELAGKKASFQIKIKEIKARHLPALDADWAREVGEYETVEDLRTAVARDLTERKNSEEEHRLQNEILEKLLEKIPFPVPPGMIDRRLARLMEDTVRNLVLQGAQEKDLAAKKDELARGLRPQAEKQVRLSFMLDKIAENEHLEVSDEEIQERLREIARRTNQPLETIQSYYESRDLLEGLAYQILTQKVVRFLREKADVKTEP
jgi:trigger factor